MRLTVTFELKPKSSGIHFLPNFERKTEAGKRKLTRKQGKRFIHLDYGVLSDCSEFANLLKQDAIELRGHSAEVLANFNIAFAYQKVGFLLGKFQKAEKKFHRLCEQQAEAEGMGALIQVVLDEHSASDDVVALTKERNRLQARAKMLKTRAGTCFAQVFQFKQELREGVFGETIRSDISLHEAG